MPSSSVRVKNEWSYTSAVPHVPTWHVKGQLYHYVFFTDKQIINLWSVISLAAQDFLCNNVKIKDDDISRHFKECISNIGFFQVKSFHSCDDFVSLIHPLCCIQKEHNFSDMGPVSIIEWKDGNAWTQVQNKELCLVTIEGLLCFCCGYQMTDEV